MTYASIMRQLGEIRDFGITELLPGRVRLGFGNDFTVFAPNKHFSLKNKDGAAIRGFWKEDFDKAFYIYKIREIIEGRCKETGRRYNSLWSCLDDPRPQDFSEYRKLEKDWIEKELEKPFVAKAHDNLNIINKTDATLSMYIEKICFYERIGDIFRFAEVAQGQGTETPWSKLRTWKRAKCFCFNAEHRAKKRAKTIHAFIHESLEQPETLLFVHFKDEQNALCHAQAAFINVMSFYLKELHEDINIIIVDVIVRDEKGGEPYLAEWKEYFKNNMLGIGGSCLKGEPAPFVMVLGNPHKDTWAGQIAFVRKQGNRLVDFDLFSGCRNGGDDKENNDLFKKNVKKAMHEIWRTAGIVANSAITLHKDYRGLPEYDVEERIWDLEDNAVVIKIHTAENDVFKMANKLCNHLMSSGCPYVTLVLADGPEDIIEVHDDTDKYTEIYNIDGSEGTLWIIERAIREVYVGHKLNGASPFLINPDPEKDPIKKKPRSTISRHSDTEQSS